MVTYLEEGSFSLHTPARFVSILARTKLTLVIHILHGLYFGKLFFSCTCYA